MSEFARTRNSYDGAEKSKRLYPALPDPLEVGTYDNHTHLEIADGDEPLSVAQHIEMMRQVNMLGAVQVGVTLESSKYSAEIAAREPMLLAAVAIHPNEAPLYESLNELDDAILEIAELAKLPRVRAVGETGLDYFRTQGDEALSMQQHSFEQHIAIAKEFDLALQIHDRDAHADVVATLLKVGAPERTVFHCYSGNLELAQICKENGWFLSFAGNVTFKKNQHLRDSLLAVDPSQLLIETDAPFLTPEPLRGRPNAPYLVPHTLRFIASLMHWSDNDLALQLNRNTQNVYGSWSEGLN
ncbi:MAG: TatD DNase family protein [Aquiluna sp.]|jgi:TatD DNase family protein|tara:strand:- start:2145 stop:3041 length:897 start_codon:yes stop_codon:yes gene_type:complete